MWRRPTRTCSSTVDGITCFYGGSPTSKVFPGRISRASLPRRPGLQHGRRRNHEVRPLWTAPGLCVVSQPAARRHSSARRASTSSRFARALECTTIATRKKASCRTWATPPTSSTPLAPRTLAAAPASLTPLPMWPAHGVPSQSIPIRALRRPAPLSTGRKLCGAGHQLHRPRTTPTPYIYNFNLNIQRQLTSAT